MSQRKAPRAPSPIPPDRSDGDGPTVRPAGGTSDASRRQNAADGLRRHFRDQASQRRPGADQAGSARPTMAVADMIVLIRAIAADLEECRDAEPLPTIRAVDADGCNWDLPSWTGDDERHGDCMALVSGAIENLRARYNLV